MNPHKHKLISWCARQPFLTSFSVGVLSVLIVLAGLQPFYLTNDDPAMAFYSGGMVLGSQPDASLYHSNNLVGMVLVNLFELKPYWPWYGILKYFLILSALVFTGYAILKMAFSAGRLALWVAWCLFFGFWFLTHLQFTYTAYLLIQAGILWMYMGFSGDRKHWLGYLGMGTILVSIGLLIRVPPGIQLWLLALPVFALHLFNRFTNPLLYRFLITMSVWVVCILAGSNLRIGLLEQDPAWKGFHQYNSQRAQIVEYHNLRDQNQIEAIGWSSNDLAMLRTWFFADSSRYSLARFKQVTSHLPTLKFSWGSAGADFKRLIGQPVIAVSVIWLALGLILFWPDVQRRRKFILLTGCMVVLGLYLLLFKKINDRTILPMLGFIGVWGIFDTFRIDIKAGRKRYFFIIGLLLLGIWWSWLYRQGSAAMERNREFRSFIRELDPSPGQLYVNWAGLLPLNACLPFDHLEYVKALKILPLGVKTNSPPYFERLREFDIDDIYPALAQMDDIFLVSDPGKNQLYARYMMEHYQMAVTFEEINRAFEFGLYRVHQKN